MQGTGWRAVKEVEWLEALDLALLSPATRKNLQCCDGKQGGIGDVFALGLAPVVPLGSPESRARLRRDARIAAYHNVGSTGAAKAGTANDGLRTLLSGLKKDPALLSSPETTVQLAQEIGKKLFSLLPVTNGEVDITMSTADMGLDSLVAVEMRGWWKSNLGFDISTMEMLSIRLERLVCA